MAYEVLEKFCQLNKIKMPKIKVDSVNSDYCGIYESRNKRITVFMKACRVPTKVPGYAWSYPGYKADKTPYGVLLHEFGHYMWDNYYEAEFRKLPKSESVSSYEPDANERCAETFKLFLGNPDLLKVLCPTRYNLIIEAGYKPVINKSWEYVLEGAHIKFFEAIRKKIGLNK